jgi:hypothetical protein
MDLSEFNLRSVFVCSRLFSRRTVRLNQSYWQISGYEVTQCLLVLLLNILREQAELINYEAVSIKYYVCVCVCVCVIRHAVRMRRIILPSVVCPAVPMFLHIISQAARF